MCSHATQSLAVSGSGKSGGVWQPLATATVYLDHPYATALDHTLNVDLFPAGGSPVRHLALELSVASARALADAITSALDGGEH